MSPCHVAVHEETNRYFIQLQVFLPSTSTLSSKGDDTYIVRLDVPLARRGAVEPAVLKYPLHSKIDKNDRYHTNHVHNLRPKLKAFVKNDKKS